jgi:4-hydroxy-tetrahydrodipicolinate synthase
MRYPKVKGVIVPLVTPFDQQGQIDAQATRQLVDFLIERGVHGLFPGGTTGEGPLLTTDERRYLAEVVVEAAAGRVPVIVHTGAITTREAIELTRHAKQIGACAAAIIPPYYYHYSDHALLNHFEQIAAQQPDFPVYLYNNPSVTGYSISKTVINELVKRCPNVVGLKDSSGSLDTLAESLSWHNGSFNSANGYDGLILAGFAIGLDACVSGNANVVPELVVALYNAVANGDLRTATTLQAKLNRVRAILGDGGDLSLFKGVLALRGVPVGAVRSPLLLASEATITECWQALSALDMPLRPLHPA